MKNRIDAVLLVVTFASAGCATDTPAIESDEYDATSWSFTASDPGQFQRLQPGVVYESRTWNGFAIRVVRVDLSNPQVHIRTTTGPERMDTVAHWCESDGNCIAAVNGDFIDVGSSPPVPNGLALADFSAWHDDSHENFIAATLNGANGIKMTMQLPYLPGDANIPNAGPFATDAMQPVPKDLKWGIGGRPTLLYASRIVAPDPSSSDSQWAHDSHVWCTAQVNLCDPFRRTATGFREDPATGDQSFFYVVVTDSRMTPWQTARVMRAMGATHALEHDSDTSTVMYLRGQGVVNNAIATPHAVVNHVGISYF